MLDSPIHSMNCTTTLGPRFQQTSTKASSLFESRDGPFSRRQEYSTVQEPQKGRTRPLCCTSSSQRKELCYRTQTDIDVCQFQNYVTNGGGQSRIWLAKDTSSIEASKVEYVAVRSLTTMPSLIVKIQIQGTQIEESTPSPAALH